MSQQIASLNGNSLYTQFFNDQVSLQPHRKFLSKVVSHFHLTQVIYLPIFSPKLHTGVEEQHLHMLDVRLCLAFYLERTKPSQSAPQLFVSCADWMKVNHLCTDHFQADIFLYYPASEESQLTSPHSLGEEPSNTDCIS